MFNINFISKPGLIDENSNDNWSFLDEKKRIIGYVIDTEPLSEKSLSIDKPSNYVLEMNGNSVFDLDMKIGDIIYFVEEKDKN